MQVNHDPQDISTLLNYGRDPGPEAVSAEIKMDLYCGIVQRQRTMYYNRSFGCQPMENYPSGIQFMIGTAHSIVTWIARRNKQTGDGSGPTVDRRVITSQRLVTFVGDSLGNVQVQVLVVPMFNLKMRLPVAVPMGGA